jgi:ADP-ribose pyrophosphatase YjhB (NUDIX family)
VTKPHRIAAGGIVLRDRELLLVRYRDTRGKTYLAGTGGAVEEGENVMDAVVREAREETGVTVRPHKVIAIEDLEFTQFKMCKVWLLCEYVSGDVQRTEGAVTEGIIEAGWFTKGALADEIIFPAFLKSHEWASFEAKDWPVLCLPSARAAL